MPRVGPVNDAISLFARRRDHGSCSQARTSHVKRICRKSDKLHAPPQPSRNNPQLSPHTRECRRFPNAISPSDRTTTHGTRSDARQQTEALYAKTARSFRSAPSRDSGTPASAVSAQLQPEPTVSASRMHISPVYVLFVTLSVRGCGAAGRRCGCRRAGWDRLTRGISVPLETSHDSSS
jgi:hypothetical protein